MAGFHQEPAPGPERVQLFFERRVHGQTAFNGIRENADGVDEFFSLGLRLLEHADENPGVRMAVLGRQPERRGPGPGKSGSDKHPVHQVEGRHIFLGRGRGPERDAVQGQFQLGQKKTQKPQPDFFRQGFVDSSFD